MCHRRDASELRLGRARICDLSPHSHVLRCGPDAMDIFRFDYARQLHLARVEAA